MDRVEELEAAILARAHRLASEYREGAEQSRDNILRNAGQQLHLREEREVLLAKAQAERTYRRMVQASELQLRREMDQLRWNLVEGVSERLAEAMHALMQQDRMQYRALLQALLCKGAVAIERDQLVAEVNQSDLEWLLPEWDDFHTSVALEKSIELGSRPIDTIGGILIRSQDNRIRVDHTFEGRLERLRSRLQQIIIERLLPDAGERSV